MSCCKYHGYLTCEKMHECDGCEVQAEWEENEKRKFEVSMQMTTRNINVGYLSALFDTAIEYISKIAVDERISEPIHKAINPTLDDMVGQLHSMKNNTMATIMFEGGEKTKVVQPVKSYRCEDCANKNTDICDRCMGTNEAGSKPSKWEQIENCSTCKYEYFPLNARCVGCMVLLPVYPHGIEVYQHWESEEPRNEGKE